MQRPNIQKAIIAGLWGTLFMTLGMYSLPIVGLPRMDIMSALGRPFPFEVAPYLIGAPIHFSIGVALALIYAAFFYGWLPGPGWMRGACFSVLPWLFAITLLTPSLQFISSMLGTRQSISNPCAAQSVNPCGAVNPCAPANPCVPKNPCAAANPCGAANPCSAAASAQASIPPQVLSLLAHLLYGVVLGFIYRPKNTGRIGLEKNRDITVQLRNTA